MLASVAVFLLSACASAPSDDTGDDTKYAQTWPLDYGATRCGQWLSRMTEKQRWVAAADMLVSARKVDHDSTDMPADGLVTKFKNEVTQGCRGSTSPKITEVASMAYIIDRATFRK